MVLHGEKHEVTAISISQEANLLASGYDFVTLSVVFFSFCFPFWTDFYCPFYGLKKKTKSKWIISIDSTGLNHLLENKAILIALYEYHKKQCNTLEPGRPVKCASHVVEFNRYRCIG